MMMELMMLVMRMMMRRRKRRLIKYPVSTMGRRRRRVICPYRFHTSDGEASSQQDSKAEWPTRMFEVAVQCCTFLSRSTYTYMRNISAEPSVMHVTLTV